MIHLMNRELGTTARYRDRNSADCIKLDKNKDKLAEMGIREPMCILGG